MLPLEGVTVLECTRLGPGPFCGMVLSDMGAEVIRVEEPRAVEAVRSSGQSPEELTRQAAFNNLNRNKRSIGLNLKHPEGREIIHSLCRRADVFVEGFRPGVMKGLSCDYETLHAINPRLVYCSITGYGQTGPYRSLPGHDLNYVAIGGAVDLIRTEEGAPVIPPNIIGDFSGGGLQAALGILGALLAREKTGEGQQVDISITDGVVYLLANAASGVLRDGTPPLPGWLRHGGGAPFNYLYECKDGGHISVACMEPYRWESLCRALEQEDFIPHQHDRTQYPEIFRAFSDTFRTRTRDEWWEIFVQDGDVAAGPVFSLADVSDDPHFQHRGMVKEVGEVGGAPVRQVGIGPKLSGFEWRPRSFAPVPGEHTDEVLAELRYTAADAAGLRARGAVP